MRDQQETAMQILCALLQSGANNIPATVARAYDIAEEFEEEGKRRRSEPAGAITDTQIIAMTPARIDDAKDAIRACNSTWARHRFTDIEERWIADKLEEIESTTDAEWKDLKDWYALREKASQPLYRPGMTRFLETFPAAANRAGQFFDQNPRKTRRKPQQPELEPIAPEAEDVDALRQWRETFAAG